MPLSLNNSKDIVANSVSIIKGNTVVDVLASLEALTGLAPATLNSLEELATALNNDAGFFSTVTTALANKADKASPTFTGSVNMSAAEVPLIKFTNAYGAPTLTSRAPGNKLVLYPSLSASLLDYAIGIEEADMFFSTENSSAGYKFYCGPTCRTTISGMGNITTTGAISSASSSTTGDCTVLGNLLIGTTNVLTSLNDKATIANLDLKAPKASPALTGTATAANLTVSGDLLIGTTTMVNVLTTLADKMATSDATAVFALKAPIASPTFTGTLTAPLIKTGRITTAAGVREGGLAWTGIIAMNTLSQ